MGVRALLPVLAAAVLAACGEDPGEAQRTWAKQADAACLRMADGARGHGAMPATHTAQLVGRPRS
jgi:hypothetical protein